ncbi:Uncharacterized protein FWK35_00007428 [Aphis craccivora]|uniref:Uncharacterized protein n=1 Tax=Aphis craccivora TaxID=307492 RepID=A0A6G0Z587_APHCR|nr:Uncharacterized protein FWK35_00007428 [Aphis craccivora]
MFRRLAAAPPFSAEDTAVNPRLRLSLRFINRKHRWNLKPKKKDPPSIDAISEPPNIVMRARLIYCTQQQQPVDEQNGGGDVGSHQTKFRSPANPADSESNRGPPGPHNTPPSDEHTLPVVSLRAQAIHN